ncbi:TolC family protein [Paraburkholderia sp. G-4-1-8]|uniref:Protein CyaE n=1 Tax=Paraburkholderia antibiotica TaxID=2728839 RepID=A0A7X9X602_9BURK|nr:TolC family protein [Paraburkholderia antibiotica]
MADPLLARPPVLDTGVALPGDRERTSCPSGVNLAAPLSLADAIDVALCSDPGVMLAWANIKLQSATVGEARAAYLPTLNASVTGMRNDTSYPAFPGSDSHVNGHTSYAALNWRLFDFGERAANRKAANDMLDAALASYDAALQKTLGTTVQAWFDAVTAQGASRARTEASRLAGETLAAAQRREEKGATGRNDTLQAQTAFARARLAAERAAGEADKTMATLVYTLGIAAGTRLLLPEDTPAPTAQGVDDLAAWLDEAKRRHPAIIAAEKQWQATRSRIASVRSQGMPTVDLGVSFYQNGYPNQGLQTARSNTTIIGVTLTIPLFEGFARTYKVREAQAQAEQDEARMQDTERQVLGDVVKAHADAVASLGELDASRTLLDSAQLALTSSRRRYDYGVADILEVLNAQSALADAQQERVRSESDWRSARLRLRAAAGVLGRQRLAGIDGS